MPQLQTLLDHYDVLIYSGQYDVILGPPGTERAIDKLRWSGANGYAAAMPMGPGLVPLVEAHHMPPMAVAPGPSFTGVMADHGFLRP